MPKRTIAGDLPAPMLAKLQPDMPLGPGWSYEPKWDGFRTIVAVDPDGSVRIVSRDGRPLGRYFPELVALIEAAGEGPFVADGEIVRVAGGAMEFDELQLRLHPAESRVHKLAGEIPATLVLFDLLREGKEELGRLALSERRARLAALAARLHWPSAPGDLASMPPAPAVLVPPPLFHRPRPRPRGDRLHLIATVGGGQTGRWRAQRAAAAHPHRRAGGVDDIDRERGRGHGGR
jgi:hypothetical protein